MLLRGKVCLITFVFYNLNSFVWFSLHPYDCLNFRMVFWYTRTFCKNWLIQEECYVQLQELIHPCLKVWFRLCCCFCDFDFVFVHMHQNIIGKITSVTAICHTTIRYPLLGSAATHCQPGLTTMAFVCVEF
jgi:hypothetical protein